MTDVDPVCPVNITPLECNKNDTTYYTVKKKDDSKRYVYYECTRQDDKIEIKRVVELPTGTTAKYLDKISNGQNKIMVSYIDKEEDSHYIFYDTMETILNKINEYFTDDKVYIVYTQTKDDMNNGFTKTDNKNEIMNKLTQLYATNSPYHKILLYRDTHIEYTLPTEIANDHKAKQDKYKAEYKAEYVTEHKGELKTELIFTIEQSKIYINLNHDGLTCWMVAVLMVLFTYKTDISERIIQKLTNATVINSKKFEHFLYNVLNGKEPITLIPYENDLYEKCRSVLNGQQLDTHITLADFAGHQGDANGFIHFLSKLYDLKINTHKPDLSSMEPNTLILTHQLTLIDVQSYKYIIMDILQYQNPEYKEKPAIFDICDNNGEVTPGVSNIVIGDTRYKLAGAIVREGIINERNNAGGHYLSIVYDPILNEYSLINKIAGNTYIRPPTAIDWRNVLYLFYYPTEQVVIGNVIIGIQKNDDMYTLVTGTGNTPARVAPAVTTGGSYYNKYCSTRNEYLKLNKMLLR